MNSSMDQAMRGLAMALHAARAKTAVEPDPVNFELRVHPDTWSTWRMQGSDLNPILADWVFDRKNLMGFKIVEDADTTPGRLILRCTWEMAVL